MKDMNQDINKKIFKQSLLMNSDVVDISNGADHTIMKIDEIEKQLEIIKQLLLADGDLSPKQHIDKLRIDLDHSSKDLYTKMHKRIEQLESIIDPGLTSVRVYSYHEETKIIKNIRLLESKMASKRNFQSFFFFLQSCVIIGLLYYITTLI